MQTDSTVAHREQAKADLKKALAAHNGDTKHEADRARDRALTPK